tara:strand:+ start:40 stop:315 length:276 start_codon:yes stop_codon:yes gene_type:complete
MISSFFPFIYGFVVLILLWQAFKVMGRGFGTNQIDLKSKILTRNLDGDRTGKVTVHPELLDREGQITKEDLLTVRFSEDYDPPQSAEKSAE